MSILEVKGIRKNFGDTEVLKGIDFTLEKGEIIERGTHDELIAKKGKYYQLYTGAFELE